MATINSYYFRVCSEGAKRKGADIPSILASAGVDPQRIRDPSWRGNVENMARLVREICLTLDDEFMGFTEHRVRPGAFGLMAEFALKSDSVLEAMQKGLRFYRVITSDIEAELSIAGRDANLGVRVTRPELDPRHYFLEFWFVVWHRFACWLAGESIGLKSARFSYGRPSEYFEEFKYLFPCSHRFNADVSSLTIDLTALQTPIRRSEAELRAMIARAPLDLMTIPASDNSVARRVRMILTPRNGEPLITRRTDEVARRLGLAPHTLRRQLRREGLSVSGILENMRRDLATQKLLKGTATVDEIAADLGYAEARSFTRAFRTWTGFSPLRYRRHFE